MHAQELPRLKKIEGQIRGIIKMIDDDRYCIDILLQLSAVRAALSRVTQRILESHIRGCVADAFKRTGPYAKEQKIREVINVLDKFGGHP
jgi:DNA-binding FrmR family transcriptional regulator